MQRRRPAVSSPASSRVELVMADVPVVSTMELDALRRLLGDDLAGLLDED